MNKHAFWIPVLLVVALFASCASDPEPTPAAPARTVASAKSAADQAEARAIEVHAPEMAAAEYQAGRELYESAQAAEAAGNGEQAMALYDQAAESFRIAREKAENLRQSAQEALDELNRSLEEARQRAQSEL